MSASPNSENENNGIGNDGTGSEVEEMSSPPSEAIPFHSALHGRTSSLNDSELVNTNSTEVLEHGNLVPSSPESESSNRGRNHLRPKIPDSVPRSPESVPSSPESAPQSPDSLPQSPASAPSSPASAPSSPASVPVRSMSVRSESRNVSNMQSPPSSSVPRSMHSPQSSSMPRNVQSPQSSSLPRNMHSPQSNSVDVTPSVTQTPYSINPSGLHFDGMQNSGSMEVENAVLPRGDLGRGGYAFNRRGGMLPGSAPSSPTSNVRPLLDTEDFEAGMGNSGHMEEMDQAVVWGTNVSVVETMRVFRDFLKSYARSEEDAANGEYYYMKLLEEMADLEEYTIAIDCGHLVEYGDGTKKLYEQLVRFPQVLIRVFDMVVGEEYGKMHAVENTEEILIQVRVFNVQKMEPIRDLNPDDIDQLVCVRGMVIRCSTVIPELKQAFFECGVCRATKLVPLELGRIDEPTSCENCSKTMTMILRHNRCAFTDKQLVKMQETPDAIPEGETPHSVTLFAFDDLVDAVRPGDKIEVTGIFRAVPMRVSTKQRVVKSVFKTYIDAIHFNILDGADHRNRVQEHDASTMAEMEQEKIAKIKALGEEPDIYNMLTNSLAPSIWELDDIKKGVLCQLFGGCDKERAQDGQKIKKFRSDINVLLCGDPGTSKSQLLSYVHRLAPRGIYTSGKGSSAVGLTASVMRDAETNDLVLESGALVLSDKGICCIDEFDKMSDSARAVLHEVMEQQTVSIAKAGIICSLNARTSILASANPIESRYNPNKSVIDNINILPTLLSRFDLIYLVIDRANVESDRRLAKHIVSLYHQVNTSAPPPIPMKLLVDYIAYAKENIHPILSERAANDLVKGYLEMRSLGNNKKCITATPRQLESLIRISEAHARLRLSSIVDTQDVQEAFRLMNVATQRTALDPRTGTINMDMLTTGQSNLDSETIDLIVSDIMSILANANIGQVFSLSDVKRKLFEKNNNTAVKQLEFEKALRLLEDDTTIALRNGTLRVLATNS